MKKLLFAAVTALALVLTGCTSTNTASSASATAKVPAKDANWLDESIPSLKDTYSDKFDSFGIACEYSSYLGFRELADAGVCDGLAKHANSITMGNEFKPDGFFGWQWTGSGKAMKEFTASNGLTIKVPASLNYSTIDKCLLACKVFGLKMRGHVLVWHSQTPDAFFTKDYKKFGSAADLVDAATMTARQEWYIKTVLEHVAEWEAKNNKGEHIVWAWDVVNEAMADDALVDGKNWLRGSTNGTKGKDPSQGGSRWFQIYGNEDFIINAFRFANAYAPEDVKLCYNDYNEYMNYNGGYKTNAIIKIITAIKNGEEAVVNGKAVKPRIDAMGMQSHVGISWPGVKGYETALAKYLALVDVHVTELDFSATTAAESKKAYSDYFTMLQRYGNGYTGPHKITNVTIWGINNEHSWIYKNNVKFPVLFNNFKATDAFWGVIEAHAN